MKCESLFADSLKMHQQLVDIFVEAKDENGISLISQPEIAARIGRSQTWVVKAIKRLNVEEPCVEMISAGKYKLNYECLLTDGVFSKIMLLIVDTRLNVDLFFERDSDIAAKYGFKLKTVQMYKAYFRLGWERSAINEQDC